MPAKSWKETSVIGKIIGIIIVAFFILGGFIIYWMPYQVLVDADRVERGLEPLIMSYECVGYPHETEPDH